MSVKLNSWHFNDVGKILLPDKKRYSKLKPDATRELVRAELKQLIPIMLK